MTDLRAILSAPSTSNLFRTPLLTNQGRYLGSALRFHTGLRFLKTSCNSPLPRPFRTMPFLPSITPKFSTNGGLVAAPKGPQFLFDHAGHFLGCKFGIVPHGAAVCNLSWVLLLLWAAGKSHDVAPACPLTKRVEFHLQIQSRLP